MKFRYAIVDGERREAEPGQKGICGGCGARLTAKCGEFNEWHWAHKSGFRCDPWWENKGPWHRQWQDEFQKEWREVRITGDAGEWHVADVKTEAGWVIEFQHSPIAPAARRAREAFYKMLAWVVDGKRGTKDSERFDKAWNAGTAVAAHVRRVYTDDCGLLRRWSESPVPVFFDFGGEWLWWRLPSPSNEIFSHLARYPRPYFVDLHHGIERAGCRNFDELVGRREVKTQPPKVPTQPIASNQGPAQPRKINPLAPPLRRRNRL